MLGFENGISFVGGMFRTLIVALLAISLAGCEVLGDIFRAGMWTGVIAVVAVVALIVYAVSRLFKK